MLLPLIVGASLSVTSHLICINQNLEQLGNQKCYHNKINAILHHFESSFEYANKKFRVICTLINKKLSIWKVIVRC